MQRISYTFMLLTCMLLGSCRHENMQVYPEAFSPYVEEFFYQANQRGYTLYAPNFNFSIQFGETDDHIGGFCNFKGNAITINPEDWEARDTFQRAHIIFHELGHCILNRDHRNEESPTNECYSYMKGTEGDFDCSLNLHSTYWRDYYLDELFDPSSALPEWYLSNRDYSVPNLNFTDSVVINDTLTDRLEISTFRFSQRDTFLFEMTFHDTSPEVKLVAFYIGNLVFLHCDDCTLTKTSLQLGNTRIYATGGMSLNTDITFAVHRNKDIVSFFVNDHFVHAMEYALIEGNLFKSRIFDEKTEMSIRYWYNE